MSKKNTDEVPMKSFNISTEDYNGIMTMLSESRNRMQRVAMDGSKADKWCKKVTKAINKIEEKYK